LLSPKFPEECSQDSMSGGRGGIEGRPGVTVCINNLLYSPSLSLLPNSYSLGILEKLMNASSCECQFTICLALEFQPHIRSVNEVVTDQKDLLPTALKYAAEIIKNSPDSVRSTKLALLLAKEMGMAES